MAASKVGVREFRAGLADFVDADEPVAITRHGHTVGYFIPVKTDRAADVAALKAAGEKLDALLALSDDEVDAMVEDFKTDRQGRREGRRWCRTGSVVATVPEDAYLDVKDEALARIQRDPDDWPVLAVAKVLDCPIWTEDNDFFGTGVPTWTTDRIDIYLTPPAGA